MSLSSMLDPKTIKASTLTQIQKLSGIAQQLDMKETQKRLQEINTDLDSDNFRIIIVGRFKNGKSTLMNALLGRCTGNIPEFADKGPMPVDSLPATAVLTSIRYADRSYVRMHRMDNGTEEWTLARYLRDAVVKDSREENSQFFKNIKHFEVGFPVELCRAGVTLIDSPGSDDTPERDEITRQAVQRCDAAIAVFRSDSPVGMVELDFIERYVSGTGTKVFTVINVHGEVSERLKGVIWDKLVTQRGGPAYLGQSFIERDIYFVNAKMAFEGKMAQDLEKLQKSGILALEERLGKFLLTERHQVHMERFVKSADMEAGGMLEKVGQKQAALRLDAAQLQANYDNVKPQLAALKNRSKMIAPIFAKYTRDVRIGLTTGFTQLINEIRQELQGELRRRMPDDAGWFDVFKQKVLTQEAIQHCKDYIEKRIDEWSKNSPDKPGAQQLIQPLMDSLHRELEAQAQELDRQVKKVRFDLTGWKPDLDGQVTVISTTERILSGLAGLIVGDYSILFGAAGGWRGVAANLAGQVLAASILAAVGLLAAPLAIPAIMVAGIVASLFGVKYKLIERIQEKVIAHVDENLRNAPNEVNRVIETEVDKMFSEMEEVTSRTMDKIVAEEERTIQEIMEDTLRTKETRTKMLANLEVIAAAITAIRKNLKEATVQYKQAA